MPYFGYAFKQTCETSSAACRKYKLVNRGNIILWLNIVTRIPVAGQRLGKHIPAEANARNNRTPIARQRISKHASLSIETVFSARSVQSGYKEVFGSLEQYITVVENEVKF
jgi:hypothetical protein